MELDENQKKIAYDFDGEIAVVAGPGSGKTRCLIERTYNMYNSKIDPKSILLISYTNKIRAEIKYRLRQRNENLEKVLVHTFHSFGIYLLRKYGMYVQLNSNFNVIDDSDIKTILNRIYTELEISKKDFPIKKAITELKIIFQKKSELYTSSIKFIEYLNSISKKMESNIMDTIFNYFTYYKRQDNYLDFDDILFYTNALLYIPEANSIVKNIKYVMIDEAQDLNSTQYEFINLLKKNNICNILLVGDFDQNIYSWRGARVDLFKNFFDNKSTKKYYLNINYRSTPQIVSTSRKLIENNTDRIKINLISDNIDGPKPQYLFFNSSIEETQWVVNKIENIISKGVTPSEIAILYRANYLSREFESELVKHNVNYIIYNGFDFYSRIEIKDTIALLKLIVNPKDRLSWERILLNIPGIGPKKVSKILNSDFSNLSQKDKTTISEYMAYFDYAKSLNTIQAKVTYLIDKLNYKEIWDDGNLDERLENYSELLRYIATFDDENIELSEFLDNISLLSKQDEHKNIDECIKLMTLHSSKGLEFEYVFIVNAVDGIIPNQRSIEDNLINEERRLMYVGMTRSKKNLIITASPFYGYSDCYFSPSRFIKEAGIVSDMKPKFVTNSIEINLNNLENKHYSKNKIRNNDNEKYSLYIELILILIGGFLGLHCFYKKQNVKGILYLFTFGVFFIGVIIDLISVINKIIKVHKI